ncbi:hypothetical protein DTB58_12300 [Streptomyces griseus]|nr:hypothetical protein [Streptomyces griseus]
MRRHRPVGRDRDRRRAVVRDRGPVAVAVAVVDGDEALAPLSPRPRTHAPTHPRTHAPTHPRTHAPTHNSAPGRRRSRAGAESGALYGPGVSPGR